MDIFQGLEQIVQRDFPVGEMTTFGVGGSAEYFARPCNKKELHDLLVQCEKHGVEVRAIGRGSNILVLDEGVPGVVVQLDRDGFGEIAIEDDLVRAGGAALIIDYGHRGKDSK